MPTKHAWLWKIYLIVLVAFAAIKVHELIMPESETYFYYFFLRAFDPRFYIMYTARVTQVLLSLVHLIPVFLYIYRRRWLSAGFWQGLFLLRCLFDLAGHSYEVTGLIAVYHSKPEACLAILTVMVIPHIPSYFACYWYAFRREKILPPAAIPTPV